MPISRDLLALLSSAENISALERLYEDVVRRVLRELAAGVSRPGASRIAATLIRIRQIAREINPGLDSRLRDWIRRELPQAFILGDKNAVADATKELEAAGGDAINQQGSLLTAWSAINQTQLAAIMASMRNRFSDVYRQVIQTSERVLRRTQLALQTDQAVRDHVVSGIVRGSAGRAISNDIARAILTGRVSPDAAARLAQAGLAGDIELYKALSQGQMIQVGGRRFNVRAYANLVAKSMQREAATIGTITRLQENGIQHVQVSEKLPQEPDACSIIAGNVYYIGPGEDPAGFPAFWGTVGGQFPPHPNCTHVVRSWNISLQSPAAIDAARGNVMAGHDYFTLEAAAASKQIRELVKAGGIAALAKINPKIYGGAAPAQPKGQAA